ncbi:MAG TPA: hypothetical protein VNG51_13800 [Ktedonobacteraceae bacterium]|nr:hypothetical protein [Ktedonobacteraceae bacterium]
MNTLIEQFFNAIQLWSEQMQTPDEDIRQYIMNCVGCFDESEDIEYNIDMVQRRVEMLTQVIHIDERFLITALVREIEQIFVDQVNDARKGEHSKRVLKIQDVKRKRWEQASEQERQSAVFQHSMNRLEQFEQSIFPTPERIAEMHRSLEAWREVTFPITRISSYPSGELFQGE